MRLGSPNRIDVVESNLKSEFDRRIIVDSDFNDLIESKINLFSIKSTDFDTKSIKRSILIDLLSIIQSKTVDLYRKLIVLGSNFRFLVFLGINLTNF